MYALRCMYYIFGACNPTFTVFYGQILVLFGFNCIPQGTIELILRDDFEQVRYDNNFHLASQIDKNALALFNKHVQKLS